MSTKLKCLLLDDELPGLTYLRMLCEQLDELEVVKAFNNPATLLAEQTALDYDLCILDIEMPDMSGLDLVPLLAKPVIFVTAHKHYAADAFDLDVVDFVQKPVNPERLRKAVAKAISRSATPVDKGAVLTELYTDKGISMVDAQQIAYIRTSAIDSRDKELFLIDGTRLLLKNITFKHLIELLPDKLFCRINKQEMIHCALVVRIAGNKVTIQAAFLPEELTLSENYRNAFFARIRL